jgi:pilus assembly protein CpaC
MTIFKQALCLLMTGIFVIGGLPLSVARAQAEESAYAEIQILKGDIETITTTNLRRVSITDPLIADINDARAKAVEVIGLEAGQTVLFIWDDMGKRTVVVRVVSEDLGLVKRRIQSLLGSAGIKGLTVNENVQEGKVVVIGDVPEDKVDVLKKVLEPMGERVINLTQQEKVQDLVQIDMQVTELSTTLTKTLGVDWGNGQYSFGEQPAVPTIYVAQVDPNTGAISYVKKPVDNITDTHIPKSNGSFKDLFKIGDFGRTNLLTATVNALISQGKGKILSKPRLVVVSGKEASIQVGGQIPIISTTTSQTGTTQTVTFKDYGITMAITPTIENGKMVNVLLNITISDLDLSNYVNTTSAGSVAFLTRSAQTQVVLEDTQTVVLAGMIKRRSSEMAKRVPLLGSIPFVGALFRNKDVPNNSETEVVISLTPTILRTIKHAAAAAAEAKNDVMEKDFSQEPVIAPSRPETSKMVIPAPDVSTPGTASEKYAMSVQQKILSAIAYPYEAQEKGWEGMVKLTLVLQRDGTLQSVVVKDSSGHEVFDQDAVNTAQILAPYAAFPSDIVADEMTLIIPIVYSLDGFLKNVVSQ